MTKSEKKGKKPKKSLTLLDDKRGKSSGAGLKVALWLIGIMAVIAMLAVAGLMTGVIKQSQLNNAVPPASNQAPGYNPAGQNPTFSMSVQDQESASSLSVNNFTWYTPAGSATSAYVGSVPVSLKAGDVLNLLLNGTGIIGQTFGPITIGYGPNPQAFKMYTYSTPNIKVFSANNALLTNSSAGGAVNESSSASTISENFQIIGVNNKNTGEMLVIVEAPNKTTTQSISLSGATKVPTPSWYTPNNVSNVVQSFLVPAADNGATFSGTLSYSPTSGKTIGATAAAAYVTVYGLQAAVDGYTGAFLNSGSLVNGMYGTTSTQDSQGTQGSLVTFTNTYDYLV